MSVEQVRQQLLEGRDCIVGAPVTVAKERWQELPVEGVGEAIDHIIAMLAGLHAQTEVALSVSVEVRDEFEKGASQLADASQGTDSVFADMAGQTVEVLTDLSEHPIRIGGELSAVYAQIARHLGSLQNLVNAAGSIRDAAASTNQVMLGTANAAGLLIEQHADSFVILDE